MLSIFFFKQKTAYEMRISDWSSDVCSSDLDRLVIEADGYDWHGGRVEFERDRERDRELVRRGYIVIRASYRQVTTDLDAVVSAALDVIRRRDRKSVV